MTRKALIVDDNAENLEALALLLRKEGLTPIVLKSPRDLASTLNDAAPFEVVFLDLEFPNYNGMQLIGDLKQNERLANVPIVAYSVHTSEVNEIRAAGFDSFLGKPLAIDHFPHLLQRILKGEQVWDTGR